MNPFSSLLTCLTDKFGSIRGGSGKSSPASSWSSPYTFNKPFHIPSCCEKDDVSRQDSDRCASRSPPPTTSWAPPSSWNCGPTHGTQTYPVSRADSSDCISAVRPDATAVNRYIIQAADEMDPTRRTKLLGAAFDKHVQDTSIDHCIPSACGTTKSRGSCSTVRDMLDCVARHRQDGLHGGEEELRSFAESGAAALRALLSNSSTGGGVSVPGSGKVLSRDDTVHRRELSKALHTLYDYLDQSPCQ